MEYRKLSSSEIELLESRGCSARDWNSVLVSPHFRATDLLDVHLSGDIRLGSFQHTHTLPGGLELESGIQHATLHNVTVGNDCRISNIHNYIANYTIGQRCRIENVGVMMVEGESTWGNGVRVSVLNETGGREVTITDRLTSHKAYMSALYRHRPLFIEKLEQITQDYIATTRGSIGQIGDDVTITNVQQIKGVKVGNNCTIEGASSLVNGTLASRSDAPVYIGNGVMLEDFIVQSDSRIEHGAMMTRCYVGQACRFGHGYSASDSLFFCNCQGENGEACAIFAGPYTVTHHKSTLLIAGLFSFMNAGSGSNQSNHMYKLGPIHQGTLERGAKTASDSYVLWPSRVGAFSLVMGRHVTHSDTTNLPFSYLIENKNATYLVPGVNLRSVGTIRDAMKWPKRDGRHADGRLDCVNYNLLSPFTLQKMMKGVETLENLRHSSGELSDIYSFHSTKITNSALHKGIEFYRIAIDKFMGNSLISRLQQQDGTFNIPDDQTLQTLLKPDSDTGSGEWVDISGLITPKSEISSLMTDVEQGKLTTLAEVNGRFAHMHAHYYSYEWTWAYEHMQQIYGIDPAQMTRRQAADIVERWREAVVRLDRMVYNDARKEFDMASMTGYGADGDREQKELDFENVRGDFETNTFVNMVLHHIDTKTALGNRVQEALTK